MSHEEGSSYTPRTPQESDVLAIIQESKQPLERWQLTQRLTTRGYSARQTKERIDALIEEKKIQLESNLKVVFGTPVDMGDFSDLLNKLG